jgi:hypothetical protein
MANFIAVPFPHMVLNSHNVPPPDYAMYNSWKVAASESVDHMIGWIAKVARDLNPPQLATLIFNAHGGPGTINIGQGIVLADASKFYGLNGLVQQIWIVACRVAGSDQEVASGTPQGRKFCQDIADASAARSATSVRTPAAKPSGKSGGGHPRLDQERAATLRRSVTDPAALMLQ